MQLPHPADQRPSPSNKVILTDGQTGTETDITDWLAGLRRGTGSPVPPAAGPVPGRRADPDLPAVAAPPRSLAPPATVPVAVEMEGFGRLTVGYHAVITQGSVLVLVYDHAVGVVPFWTPPQPKPDSPPLGMLVGDVGSPDAIVHLAHYTGVQFRDGAREYLVFTVERSARPGDRLVDD